MYLHSTGRVTACCVSTHVLGNVADQPLTEIWRGHRARELRRAMVDYDLGRGCNFCQWQVAEDIDGGAFAVEFDSLAITEPDPDWPRQLEFELSNTCNLACIMCNGDLSSTIRSRRERLPPMPKVYGNAFFEDLREFLPHLERAAFLGGEPFLAAEAYRVWALLLEVGSVIPCTVVTNGTQWNDRVERVLEAFPVSITVSIDGATAATFERIRLGASFAEVMANLGRFRAYTRDRGTDLHVAFCLMRENWHEFADLLLLADALDVPVRVNTVTDPVHGLAQLSLDELAPIVSSLDVRDGGVRSQLRRNREVWSTELARLHSWCDQRLVGAAAPGGVSPRSLYLLDSRAGTLPDDLRAEPGPHGATEAESARMIRDQLPGCELSVLYCDDGDRVVGVGSDDGFLGVPADRCVGRPFADLVHELQQLHGEQMDPLDTVVVGGGVLRRVIHRTAGGRSTYLAGHGFAGPVPGGAWGSVTVAGWSLTPPEWALERSGPE